MWYVVCGKIGVRRRATGNGKSQRDESMVDETTPPPLPRERRHNGICFRAGV